MNEPRKVHDTLLPERLLDGTQRSWDLDHLHRKFLTELTGKVPDLVQPGQDWMMGYIIPPFQRPLVWDLERKVRFVESAQLGIHLGIFVYNSADALEDEVVDGKKYFHHTHLWLVDGQQRLSAFQSYFNNEFPVFGHYWESLGVIDQRKFLRTPFHAVEISTDSERKLHALYNRMNYGGVAHAAEDQLEAEETFPSSVGP